MQGKRQKGRLKEVSIFLLIPQSTSLPEGDSSECKKDKVAEKITLASIPDVEKCL